MSDNPIAVIGTRRTMRELVDGTIRIQIDIDPQYRSVFLQHYPLDAAVAIVPVKAGPAPNNPQSDVSHPASQSDGGAGTGKPGPLCLLACQWCGDDDFREWLVEAYPGDGPLAGSTVTAEGAARIVRGLCGVESRKSLDHIPEAAAAFHEFIREPYSAYLKERGE